MGFEPTTLTLARLHSTTELFPRRSHARDMKPFCFLVNRVSKKIFKIVTVDED